MNFSDYFHAVKEHNGGGIGQYIDIFPPNTNPFFNSLWNVIETFLNYDGTCRSLFIQVPMENLGRNDVQQCKNFRDLQTVAARILELCTSKSFFERVKIDENTNLECGDNVFLDSYPTNANNVPNDITKAPYCVSMTVDDNTGQIVPNGIFNGRHAYCGVRRTFNHKRSDGHAFRIDNIPQAQYDAYLRKFHSLFETINSNRTRWTGQVFNKALLIGLGNFFADNQRLFQLIRGYVSPQMDFCTGNQVGNLAQYDVCICVGDNSFENCQNQIQNALAYPNMKKFIYIGTHCGIETDCKFSYSYRELYSYFYGINNFIQWKFVPINSDWFRNVLTDLQQIIQDTQYSLNIDQQRTIESLLLYRMMDIRYPKGTEFDIESVVRFACPTGMCWDLVDALGGWLQRHPLRGNNSKKEYLNQITQDNTKNCFVFYRCDTPYQRRLNAFIQRYGNDRHNNIYIFDGMRKNNLEAFKYCLEQGILGEFHFVYYEPSGMQKLVEFLNREKDVYSGPSFRNVVYNGIDTLQIEDVNLPGGAIANNDGMVAAISDVYDAPIPRQYKGVYDGLDSFCVTFEDGSSVTLNGDVVINNQVVSMWDLYENIARYKGETLYYYDIDDGCFREMSRLYKGLPEDRTEQYYADLWQNRLRQLFEKEYNNSEQLARDMNIDTTLINRYLNPNNTNLFLQNEGKMLDVCNFLVQREYLDSRERSLVMNARRSHFRNQSIGRSLKKDVLDYVINSGMGDCIRIIQNNATLLGVDFDIAKLIDMSVRNNTLSQIEYQE